MDANSEKPGEVASLALALVQAQAEWLASLIDAAVTADARDSADGGAAAQAWAQSAARIALTWRDATAALGQDEALGERLTGWLDQLAPVTALARRLDWPALGAKAMALAEEVLGQHGLGPRAAQLAGGDMVLPRADPRFADPAWREQPAHALLHQLYLLLGEELAASLADLDDVPADERAALRATALRLMVLADPSGHAALRPGFWAAALETRGASAAELFDRLVTDMLHCTKAA